MAINEPSQKQMLSKMINNNSCQQYLIRFGCFILMVIGSVLAIEINFFAISLLKTDGWDILLALTLLSLAAFFIMVFIAWVYFARNRWVILIGVFILVAGIVAFFIIGKIPPSNNMSVTGKVKL